MVRHGQYNLDGKVDEERYLTDLGKKQAELTGQRLAHLYKDYISGQLVGFFTLFVFFIDIQT
jgi:broad specificity phosphatase PhoE